MEKTVTISDDEDEARKDQKPYSLNSTSTVRIYLYSFDSAESTWIVQILVHRYSYSTHIFHFISCYICHSYTSSTRTGTYRYSSTSTYRKSECTAVYTACTGTPLKVLSVNAYPSTVLYKYFVYSRYCMDYGPYVPIRDTVRCTCKM